MPTRELARLSRLPGIVGRIDPIADILIIEVNNTGEFQREEVRLAAHHAIDKQAISKAFYGGKAIPIAVPAAHGTPGYPKNFDFPHAEPLPRPLPTTPPPTPPQPPQIV